MQGCYTMPMVRLVLPIEFPGILTVWMDVEGGLLQGVAYRKTVKKSNQTLFCLFACLFLPKRQTLGDFWLKQGMLFLCKQGLVSDNGAISPPQSRWTFMYYSIF